MPKFSLKQLLGLVGYVAIGCGFYPALLNLLNKLMSGRPIPPHGMKMLAVSGAIIAIVLFISNQRRSMDNA